MRHCTRAFIKKHTPNPFTLALLAGMQSKVLVQSTNASPKHEAIPEVDRAIMKDVSKTMSDGYYGEKEQGKLNTSTHSCHVL